MSENKKIRLKTLNEYKESRCQPSVVYVTPLMLTGTLFYFHGDWLLLYQLCLL